MAYTPPSVQVTSIANNRIINITGDARIPAIVGAGPSLRTVTDQAVIRGSGAGPDQLNITPSGSAGTVSLTRVAAYPGAPTSNSNWDGYYSLSGSFGDIYWDPTATAGSDAPQQGEIYYVSYTYPVSDTQFEPTLFTDSRDIIATYGSESATNKLTVAANMALENGAPAVMCLQVSGSASSLTNWQSAFDKLKKKSNIAYVVPVTTDTDVAGVVAAALQHCNEQSSPIIGHERETIVGMDSSATVGTLISKSDALDDKRAILVAPGASVTRTAPTGTSLTLDGSYIAAALAGLITAQDKPIQPVTGKIITGFVIPDDQYEPYEMNRMAAEGITVIYAKSGVNKVRHAITTDPTSADTYEISVVAADDMVRRITREKLTDAYIGKGLVITESTPAQVVGTVKAIWNSLVRDGLIFEYGTKNDPTTGEVPISAVQDPNEPTRINVTGAVKFLYPLNYINLEFYIYV